MIMSRYYIAVILFSMIFFSCDNDKTKDENKKERSFNFNIELVENMPNTDLVSSIPELTFYHKQLTEAMQQEYPILMLSSKEIRDSNQYKAQKIAISSPSFRRDLFHKDTKKPLRNEIMSVNKTLPSDFKNKNIKCADCYTVIMYNYYDNSTTRAIVDTRNEKVLQVNNNIHGQPEINKRLTDIAVQIAINSPEVKSALEYTSDNTHPIMPNVKTALNGTKCERSKHLCVAPTFINHVNKRALWAIVDLTDWKLVGIKWTELGDFDKDIKLDITERSLENEYIMENFCEKDNSFVKGDWEFEYRLTNSDGMEIINAKYKGEKVINSVKIVDWHVSYSKRDNYGYSDATGCPMFSSSAVIPFNGPQLEPIDKKGKNIGFSFVQDFRSPSWPTPCNYRYENRYEFYKDGSFRIKAVNLGRGCGTDGIYRPVFRMDLTCGENGEIVEQWKNNKWNKWDKEGWMLQDKGTKYDKNNNLFKITTGDNKGYYFEPSFGQFDDGGRGDNAFVYFSKHKVEPDEGDLNMVTIGSCCNTDYKQGPEKFIEPSESLEKQDIIIWYVPQMHNDDRPGKKYCWAEVAVKDGKAVVETYPGTVGPLFKPFKK